MKDSRKSLEQLAHEAQPTQTLVGENPTQPTQTEQIPNQPAQGFKQGSLTWDSLFSHPPRKDLVEFIVLENGEFRFTRGKDGKNYPVVRFESPLVIPGLKGFSFDVSIGLEGAGDLLTRYIEGNNNSCPPLNAIVRYEEMNVDGKFYSSVYAYIPNPFEPISENIVKSRFSKYHEPATFATLAKGRLIKHSV